MALDKKRLDGKVPLSRDHSAAAIAGTVVEQWRPLRRDKRRPTQKSPQ